MYLYAVITLQIQIHGIATIEATPDQIFSVTELLEGFPLAFRITSLGAFIQVFRLVECHL